VVERETVMPNSTATAPPPYDPGIEIGILRERQQTQGQQITSIDNRVSSLETEMRRGFSDVLIAMNSMKEDNSRAVAGIRDQTTNALNIISADIAASRRPQWQAISVGVAILVVLGGLVYWPIKQEAATIREDVAALQKGAITRDETEAFRRRASEDRVRTETAISDLRATSVPRGEYTERASGINERFGDISRRIEDLRSQVGATYGLRDFIQDLNRRLDRVEENRRIGP
jgi:hypothetical protein